MVGPTGHKRARQVSPRKLPLRPSEHCRVRGACRLGQRDFRSEKRDYRKQCAHVSGDGLSFNVRVEARISRRVRFAQVVYIPATRIKALMRGSVVASIEAVAAPPLTPYTATLLESAPWNLLFLQCVTGSSKRHRRAIGASNFPVALVGATLSTIPSKTGSSATDRSHECSGSWRGIPSGKEFYRNHGRIDDVGHPNRQRELST
jgi:hypothetical protein